MGKLTIFDILWWICFEKHRMTLGFLYVCVGCFCIGPFPRGTGNLDVIALGQAVRCCSHGILLTIFEGLLCQGCTWLWMLLLLPLTWTIFSELSSHLDSVLVDLVPRVAGLLFFVLPHWPHWPSASMEPSFRPIKAYDPRYVRLSINVAPQLLMASSTASMGATLSPVCAKVACSSYVVFWYVCFF